MSDGAATSSPRKGLRGTGGRAVIQSHLDAGRPVYYSRPDTPRGLLLKEHSDGRIELIQFDASGDRVLRVVRPAFGT